MKMRQYQSGMSLVEIMIAMVISLFLLGGIVQVYLGNKTTYRFTNALSRIQENGRFALDIMSQDLRLAGDWGCIGNTNAIGDHLNAATVPNFNSSLHDFLNNPPLEGTENLGLNNSDTLTVRGSKPGKANIEAPFSPTTVQRVFTDTINTIAAGDIVFIARCGANDLSTKIPEGEVFRVTSVAPGNFPSQRLYTHNTILAQQYENDATITELQTVTYSIATGTSGGPALFRAEFGNNQELIEGIQDMQILYGIDSDNDGYANQYLPSSAAGLNFNTVVSLRIMLLVRSIEQFVTESPQTYSFNGTQITAGDNRLRQVFTTTIALRNRINRIIGS